MLRAIERLFVTWRFAVFSLTVLLGFAALLAGLWFVPPATDGLGAFAREFRVWCFGVEGTSERASWQMAAATAFELLSLSAIIAWVWSRQLKAQWLEAKRAFAPWVLAAGVVVLALAGTLFAMGAPASTELAFPARELRTSIAAPRIELTNHEGQPVSLAALEGRVVVVTAVYATCGTACPRILGQVKRVMAKLTPEQRAAVTVLGVSLDPEHDTPEMLSNMASGQKVKAPDYQLLTGAPEVVNATLDAMQVSRTRDPATGKIDHQNLFLLIDRRQRVAYRFTLGDVQERWMVEALQTLLREPGERLTLGSNQ
jgi:protein SCO1/2